MLEGYQLWQIAGLTVPDTIKRATEEYRTESDTIGRFIEERCSPYTEGLKPGGLKASNVYDAYKQWSVQEGFRPMASARFGQKMVEKGFRSEKKRDGFH